MVRGGEHLKFFQFCSPLNATIITGEHGGIFWLESIKLIDFKMKNIIEDSFFVGLSSKGAITMKDLMAMDYIDYKYAVDRSIAICKKLGILKE